MVEPFKYLIQPIAVERNEEGRIVREMPGEVLHVYTLSQALDAIQTFEAQLERLSKEGESDASEDGD